MVVEKNKLIANYLGWKYIPFGGESMECGWYKPCHKLTKGCHKGFIHVCRNHHQLNQCLSLEVLFEAVDKVQKEDVKFGYSWESIDDNTYYNNQGIKFSIFENVMEFYMERSLDPPKTISEKKLQYLDLKSGLKELICETLEYLEDARL